MAGSNKCKTCKKARKGRYTQIGRDNVAEFYCYQCHPEGQGRDEETPDATPKTKADIYREQGLALTRPVLTLTEGLEVVDEPSYLMADEVLGKVRAARKGWGGMWAIIQDRSIKHLRQALEGLYSVNREVDGPLEAAEKAIKKSMADYKTLEARRLQQAREQAEREERERIRKIEELSRQAEQAKTPQAKATLTRQVDRLEVEQERAELQPLAVPVQGAHSSTRLVKVPRIVDLSDFAAGIASGAVPEDEVRVLLEEWLARVYRRDALMVEAMPGVVIAQEPQIVGGR